jgi:hypothetical protein
MSKKDTSPNIKISARKSNGNKIGDGSPLRTSLAISSYQECVGLPKYDADGLQIIRGGSIISSSLEH